jgi:NhaP-type Na+/H+ or K+/H+ antiporter
MYAQSRLNVPQDPPQTQEDLLATALQPIISFVVLGSILTHGLSIPLFSVFQYITRLKAREMDVETSVLAANGAKIYESDQPTPREAEIPSP